MAATHSMATHDESARFRRSGTAAEGQRAGQANIAATSQDDARDVPDGIDGAYMSGTILALIWGVTSAHSSAVFSALAAVPDLRKCGDYSSADISGASSSMASNSLSSVAVTVSGSKLI